MLGKAIESILPYLGFAMTFDSVNHRLILVEIKAFSLDEVAMRWIETYGSQENTPGKNSQCSGLPQDSLIWLSCS